MKKQSDKTNTNAKEQVIFLGIGSYNYMKNKKSQKGYFWTIKEDKFLLMSTKYSVREFEFNSYPELITYCNKNIKDFTICT